MAARPLNVCGLSQRATLAENIIRDQRAFCRDCVAENSPPKRPGALLRSCHQKMGKKLAFLPCICVGKKTVQKYELKKVELSSVLEQIWYPNPC